MWHQEIPRWEHVGGNTARVRGCAHPHPQGYVSVSARRERAGRAGGSGCLSSGTCTASQGLVERPGQGTKEPLPGDNGWLGQDGQAWWGTRSALLAHVWSDGRVQVRPDGWSVPAKGSSKLLPWHPCPGTPCGPRAPEGRWVGEGPGSSPCCSQAVAGGDAPERGQDPRDSPGGAQVFVGGPESLGARTGCLGLHAGLYFSSEGT